MLYTFVGDALSVDDSTSGFCKKIVGLSRVLEVISQAWKQNPLLVAAQANADGNLWISVQASLDNCKNTLEKLEKNIYEAQKSSFLWRGFLRKSTMSIKLNMRMGDITTFKQKIDAHWKTSHRVVDHRHSCLLLNSNTSQEPIAQALVELKSQRKSSVCASNTK